MITRNPELLRHVRSELRPARVAVILSLTYGLALLMAMFLFQQNGERALTQSYWRDVFGAIFVASTIFVVLWSLLNVSQCIVSERTHRTFDFWRTTRLSPTTLTLGKLFGAPLGAWLVYAAVLPLLLTTGLLAHFPLPAIVGSYLVVALANVALCAVALCGSARAQDTRRATLVAILVVLGVLASGGGADALVSSAWSALNPAGAIRDWLYGDVAHVLLFGHAVPMLLVTAVLSLAAIAWCLVALARCIKFEPDQISLFSPSQVVGVSASILLFVYAAFRPVTAMFPGSQAQQSAAQWTLQAIIGTGIAAAIGCLYFTITATLLTRDNLRQQLRKRAPTDVALRAAAPWVATGILGLVAAVFALNGYRHMFAGAAPQWSTLIAMYLSIIAYGLRDGMFLQWMMSQKIKAPVLKGSALLICYYVATSVLSAVLAGPENMRLMLRWLVPYIAIPGQVEVAANWMIVPMLIPPIATAALLAVGTFRSIRRSSQAATALASANS